jgi:hypothetical protein
MAAFWPEVQCGDGPAITRRTKMGNIVKWPCLAGFGAIAGLVMAGILANGAAAQPMVIELTQVACQFVEAENGIDRNFQAASKADCEAINAKSAADRLAKAAPLRLKAGEYIFRVTNQDVPYTLGFWLRSKGYNWANPVHKLTKVSISGGGMTTGKTLEYKVTLKPGEYVYSCPLNTTPDYRLIVSG